MYRKIYKYVITTVITTDTHKQHKSNTLITYKQYIHNTLKMKRKQNKSFFLMQFGDTPQLRVLDFLIDNHFFDFPMTEIARESNVSYNSIILFFNDWIKSRILINTRKVGKSDYYKFNLENPFVKNLIKLDWTLTKSNTLLGSKEKILA